MKQKQISRLSLFFVFLAFAAAILAPVVSQAQSARQRSEIDDKYKWRVEDIYASAEAWQKDFDYLKDNMTRFEGYKGRLGESPATLLACLKLSDSLNMILENLYVYAYLKLDEDNRSSEYQELTGSISDLNAKFSEIASYIEPELLSMGKDKLLGMVDQEAGLGEYRFYLNDLLRRNAHVLPAEQEALLSLAGPVTGAPAKIFGRLEDADITYGTILDENGQEVEMTRGRLSIYLESQNRRVRKDARKAYNDAYLKIANTLAATLEGSLKSDYFYSQARKYNSCLDMSLDRYNIPTSVFNNLIDAVNANLAPLHKWASLRKRILGVDTLFVWDLSVPLVPDFTKSYEYEEATKMMTEALKPLGKDYLKDVQMGLGSGWIDVYETQGKGSGAYSWGTYSSHPYILMNWAGSLEDMFTLAHEMGHALHSYYTNRTEPYIYGNHSLFIAEVSSTCNEAIVMKYMIKNTKDKKEKMYLINKYIEQIIGTFFTQVMFSEFELAIHKHLEEGGAFSADYFRKTYRDIYQKYWGPELVIDDENDLGGMRISHFYRQYYVYQYATGYAAALAMSDRIVNNEKGALEKYQHFLSVGTSKYPIDVLKDADVDMTQPEAVARTLKVFGELVDEMERLLNEG